MPALVLFFGAGHGPNAQGPAQDYTGVLSVVWGDPHPDLGSGGEIRYELTLPDGRVMRLELTGQDSIAASYSGRQVVVSGRAAPARADASGPQFPPTLIVDSVAPGEPPLNAPDSPAVTGTRKVIYLLVKFPGDAEPHAPSFFTNMTNPDTPPMGSQFPSTINGFFKKTSWNQFSWVGDVGGVGGVGAGGGWLTLPNPKTFYANCGWNTSCANLSAIANDATALGRAEGIVFTNYDNINFVLSNDLDCCAWGGSYFSSFDSKVYGATWEPPWGQNAGTYGHEMGHSIGLPHSGWVYYAYDSPWDVMSSIQTINSMGCGSYQSINSGSVSGLSCGEPGDGYIAAHKDYQGWIPPANQVVTDTVSNVTVALEGLSLPLTSAVKMIKICLTGYACSGGTARYLTVEARVKALGGTSQFDNGIPNEGVIIQEFRRDRPKITGACYFNDQSGWALPIDATPGDYNSVNCNSGGRAYPNYGLYNAHWTPGRAHVNATYGARITVLNRTGSTYLIAVGSATFTDDALSAGSSVIKLVHITELRSRINVLRTRFGLSQFSWTDPSPVAGVTTAKGAHITELRTALNQAYTQASIAAPAYTDPALPPAAFLIKAVHIQELRSAVMALEAS